MFKFKRVIYSAFILIVLASNLFFLWVSNHYVVPIIMYHSVGYAGEDKPNFVRPDHFEYQMAYLREHQFDVVTLGDYLNHIKGIKRLMKKSVVLTFDDGFVDNYTNAFEILKKYDYPAVMFVPSDYINMEGRLTLAQLKEMIKDKIDIGSHTRHHVYLPDKSQEVIEDEVIESKRILESKLGTKVDFFAYPIGGFNEEVKKVVKLAGYRGATATNRGYDPGNRDLFELNRIRLSNKDVRDHILWMKFSGYYNLLRGRKNPD